MNTETVKTESAGAGSLHPLVSRLSVEEKDSLLSLLIFGVRDMEAMMGESRGVCGLHLNGDDAEWSSLVTGGRFEEWLHRWNQGVVMINDLEERQPANVERSEPRTQRSADATDDL